MTITLQKFAVSQRSKTMLGCMWAAVILLESLGLGSSWSWTPLEVNGEEIWKTYRELNELQPPGSSRCSIT